MIDPDQKFIIVRYNFPAFHRWDGAPAGRAYLGEKHRHIFFVEVKLEVFHDDREVEFHDLLDFCKPIIGQTTDGQPDDLGSMSCEMIANQIAQTVADTYNERWLFVSVFEDNECGAEVSLLA